MKEIRVSLAEVKAIASGHPLVIEKSQVDAELMRFTQMRPPIPRSNQRRGHTRVNATENLIGGCPIASQERLDDECPLDP